MKQYTIRSVPEHIDTLVRELAARRRKSINAVLLEALTAGLNARQEIVYHDMDDLAGTWVEDPETDEALEEFERVDPELWR